MDLVIKFTGPLHSWLQQFTNHYLTCCHLPTGHTTGTSLTSKWTPPLLCCTPLYSLNPALPKSKSHCNWRSVTQWVLVSRPDIYYCLTVMVLFLWGASLTGGQVCLLYMLLGLSRAVFLGSKSFGTHDHILLSQIWDFPFRRLLWLTGSWCRYSTPPQNRCWSSTLFCTIYNSSAQTPHKTLSSVAQNECLLVHYLALDVLYSWALVARMCLPSLCPVMGICITV
jgi:hypothetical protein